MDWLNKRGIQYETLDAMTNAKARKEMFALSGQTLPPVIDVDAWKRRMDAAQPAQK